MKILKINFSLGILFFNILFFPYYGLLYAPIMNKYIEYEYKAYVTHLKQLFAIVKVADGPHGQKLTFEVMDSGAAYTVMPSTDMHDNMPPIASIHLNVKWSQQYTDSQIVLVLSHEVGHTHNEVNDSGESKKVEYAADLYGVKLMRQLCYTKEEIQEAAKIFLGPEAANGGMSHPAGKDRYDNIVNNLYGDKLNV